MRNLPARRVDCAKSTVGKRFYTDFRMAGQDYDQRIVMRCPPVIKTK
jgi:hypothetical protein